MIVVAVERAPIVPRDGRAPILESVIVRLAGVYPGGLSRLFNVALEKRGRRGRQSIRRRVGRKDNAKSDARVAGVVRQAASAIRRAQVLSDQAEVSAASYSGVTVWLSGWIGLSRGWVRPLRGSSSDYWWYLSMRAPDEK